MTESINPYQVSQISVPTDPDHFDPSYAARGHSMLSQLTVVGILQIVQGSLELLMASSLIGLAIMFPLFAAQSAQNSNPQLSSKIITGMTYYYGIAGGATLIFSILRITAGITSFWFRGRILMWISLLGGLASCLTFYCSITSIALAIYGAIIMSQPAVKYAYRLAKSGMPAKLIREKFGYAYYHQFQGMP